MRRLLSDPVGPGYPGDYLLARIQGRRIGLLTADGGPGGTAAADRDDGRCWRHANRERAWLFRQLDPGRRAALAPLFVFFELGAVAQALRFLAGDRPGEAESLLEGSMLAPAIRIALGGREGVAAVLARLERSPVGRLLSLAGIRESYDQGGLRRCEELLRGRFLARALSQAHQRDLRLFFRAAIDARNILAVAKWLRWRPSAVPLLLPGGEVPLPASLEKMTEEGLARMVRQWTHKQHPTGERLRPEHLEPVLHAHLLDLLTRRRREGGVAAACIEYAWRCSLSARECSLRLHAAGEAGR